MSSPPGFLCVRCGRPVHKRGTACRDCRAADPLAEVMSINALADLARRQAKAAAYLRPTAKSATYQEATP